MPVSFSQPVDLECPQCHARVHADVWLIVDAGERADLAARCRDGSIFQVMCPNGHTAALGAPLLYHDRARELVVLAVPLGMDEQHARAIHAQLMPRLLANFIAPFPAYLERTRVVPLENLADVLADDARCAIESHGSTDASRVNSADADADEASRLEPTFTSASRQFELAALLQEIARLTRLSDMPRKIELCEQALRLVQRESNPSLWAALQVELANALQQNPLGNRAENLERAIAHYELALQVRTREAFPEQWAMTQNNLATAYRNRIRGERAENLEEAIRHYEQALQVYTVDLWADRARTTARNLANVAQERSDWGALHTALDVAMRAGERLFRDTISTVGIHGEAQELARLCDRDIATCLKLVGQNPSIARDILLDAEAARSRAFLREMGLGEIPPPADIPADLLARENDLRLQLREVTESLTGVDTRTDRATEVERTLVARRAALTRELEQTWNEMLQLPSPVVDGGGKGGGAARDYISLRRGDTPTWDKLRALAQSLQVSKNPKGLESALVEFHNLVDQTIAIVWRAGWDAPRVVQIPLSQDTLFHRYLQPYQAEVLNYVRHVSAGRAIYNDWLDLGEILLAPLEPLLGDAALVYFIPHGNLHLIPLHALTCNGAPFIAKRAVAYAPSAAVLERAIDLEGLQDLPGLPALVMGYALRPEERPTFIGEAEEIAALFGGKALVDGAATKDALAERAPDAPLIHLSCHGVFRADDALGSAVLLADGLFTARDWMRLKLRADLVTLSACQLAFSGVNAGDDLVGMARALFYAGASSLLLALWSVQSDTTKEWMLDFYRRVQAGKAKSLAAQEATLALREHHKAEPHIWAPFVLMGDWR